MFRRGDTEREGEDRSGGRPGSPPPLKYDVKVPLVRSLDRPGPPGGGGGGGDRDDGDCECCSFFGGA